MALADVEFEVVSAGGQDLKLSWGVALKQTTQQVKRFPHRSVGHDAVPCRAPRRQSFYSTP